MFKQKTQKLALAFVFMFTTLMASHSSFAEVNKMVHGAECKAYFETDIAKIRSTDLGVANISDTHTWVLCPLQRDYVANTKTLRSTFHRYHQVASTTTCYLRKVTPSTLTQAQAFGTGGGIGTGFLGGINITEDAMFGDTVSFLCYLAPYGYLVGINYVDNF